MAEKYWHAEEDGDAQSFPFQAKQDLSKQSVPDWGGFRFTKDERLCRLGTIEDLFREGKAVHHNSFTLVYFFASLPTAFPAQVLISVPKRNFKRSHDRNHIKRLLREAWRHQKHGVYNLLGAQQKQMALALVYKGSAIPSHDVVQSAIGRLIEKLISRLQPAQ